MWGGARKHVRAAWGDCACLPFQHLEGLDYRAGFQAGQRYLARPCLKRVQEPKCCSAGGSVVKALEVLFVLRRERRVQGRGMLDKTQAHIGWVRPPRRK